MGEFYPYAPFPRFVFIIGALGQSNASRFDTVILLEVPVYVISSGGSVVVVVVRGRIRNNDSSGVEAVKVVLVVATE